MQANPLRIAAALETERPTSNASDAYGELVARARALRPMLRTRAQQAEELGRTPDDVIAALHEAGVFRMVQPARVGGYELSPRIFLDVSAELAKECPSTSWVVNNLASHHLQLALWPVEAQDEIWGASRDVLVGSSYVWPAGKAVRVKGGYRLNGRWPFSSGIHPCQWVALGAMADEGNGGAPSRRYFLVPECDYEIINTWHVSGLRGTGSDDVSVADIFVPEHRTLNYDDMARGEAPGLQACSGPLFRFPMPAAGGFLLVCSLYGAAQGALEQFVQGVRTHLAKSSGQATSDHVPVQQRIARASAVLDTVEMTVRRRLDDTMAMLENDGCVPGPYLIRLRRDAAYCAQLCVEAVDLVFGGGGGAALYQGNPLQRFWRDVHAGAANLTIRWDAASQAYGRVQLGLPSGVPGLPL